jgi:hypothetical protein
MAMTSSDNNNKSDKPDKPDKPDRVPLWIMGAIVLFSVQMTDPYILLKTLHILMVAVWLGTDIATFTRMKDARLPIRCRQKNDLCGSNDSRRDANVEVWGYD